MPESTNSLVREIEELFRRQTKTWPRLARGVEGLAQAETKPVHVDWFEVFVRHIPHRVTSTTAAVDRESIAKRPCFLCVENLDPQEEGIPFGPDFTIYCNPYPIVDRHLTIVHRKHIPQAIAGHIGTMLDVAVALPGYFVIYNGPECGASAPDHMHFQAGSRALFPIEKETAGLTAMSVPNYARTVLLCRGTERSALIHRIDQATELIGEATGKRPEPLINIAAFYEKEQWTVYLFPRQKHRPDVFHTGELTVSPASIDLCGIFVVPLANDFARITGDTIAALFREVSLAQDKVREIALKLESDR